MNYNAQANIDRINNQIAELERMKSQIPQIQQGQPPAINQTFQIAPNNQGVMRYANSIEDVKREMVIVDTPYFSKDLSILWIKNSKGEIKSYELNEIIEKDEKDLQIEFLQSQLDELKGMIKNEQSNTDVDDTESQTNTTTVNETIRKPIKESKSTSIQRISTSKKK
jgi:hypothetical protein